MKDVRMLLLNQITSRILFFGLLLFMLPAAMKGEGSVDFINYPGLRLFLWPQETHQLKVYANEGEFINVGASHVGITGGFITVYRPDGTVHTVFDDTGATAGLAIINNDVEEKGGPTGGGTTMGTGYEPGVVNVGASEAGVWTIMFEFPTYNGGTFANLANDAPWDRMTDQPTIQRTILAWDITVSKDAAANEDGKMLEGRVYANKFASMVSQNGNFTSPTYYVLTKQGIQYQVDCNDIDPYGFPIFSNSTGVVNGQTTPLYRSIDRTTLTTDTDPSTWTPGDLYLYDPMAQDLGSFINNKVFFNIPNPDLPASAVVTDIINMVTHETWLFSEPLTEEAVISDVSFVGVTTEGDPCQENTMNSEGGAYVYLNTNAGGNARLALDLNNDGDYLDATDRIIYKQVNPGMDSIYWDGKDGTDMAIPEILSLVFNYDISIRNGETHILFGDVENNGGGITITRINGPDAPIQDYYFDHSQFDPMGVSGGGTAGDAKATTDAYTYSSNWGNDLMLDYWTYVPYNSVGVGMLEIAIAQDCTIAPDKDSDGDGVVDLFDIDDDNDGILDALEYCNPTGTFACLPGGFDPSVDDDGDRILNYLDADLNDCIDTNNDGACDQVPAIYDMDGDNVPDHLDVDSDNDGITDLVEAGHAQADADGNGVIDGMPADFGTNGFFNAIATDANDFAAQPTYTRFDFDNDGIPDHDDLDSDNDGINDVTEAGFGQYDTNNDGRIDDGAGNIPTVGETGLVSTILDPVDTAMPIPLPQDHDMDGIPDWHDLDSDNDGIHDVVEGGNIDLDNDGMIGMGMPTVDTNGLATTDTMGNTLMPTSRPQDYDMDGIPDWHDLDSDNDAINDVVEGGATDPDNDGIIGMGMPMVDANGVATNDADGTPVSATSKPLDQDGDGIPDWHDLDSDNDGINDVTEGGNPDPDNDGIVGTGMPTVDQDGLATTDADGNPLMTTSILPDSDMDGIPNWHDLDSDNDGINDVVEGGAIDPDNDGIIGTGTPTVNDNGQAITDAEGNPLTTTSNPPNTDGTGEPDYLDLDSDDDGLTDVHEAGNPDPDNDGIIGTGTPTVNGSGQAITDGAGNPVMTTSDPIDFDEDGTPDFQDIDSDNDNINDQDECPMGLVCPDTDDDGTPDWHDTDSDDDGIPDNEECAGGAPCPDTDGDTTLDVLEYNCWEMTTPVIADMIGQGVYCEGDELLLGATNIQTNIPGIDEMFYQWTGPNGFVYTDMASTLAGNFDVFIPSVNLTNEGPYTLLLTTDKGCQSEPVSLHIDVKPMPETPLIDVTQDVLCDEDLLELNTNAYTGEEVNYQWYFNNGSNNTLVAQTTIPTLFVDDVTNDMEGIYTLAVTVDGCESQVSNAQDVTIIDQDHIGAVTDEVEVMFGENQMVENLDANDVFDINVIDGWEITVVEQPQSGSLNENTDGTYTYVPDYHFYGEDQFTYQLCSTQCPDICDDADVVLRIIDREEWGDCYIPNFISPNGDGYNDDFFIPCAVKNPDNEIKIFNRWGDKVYESIAYKNDWKGTYDGIDLPAGTYFYIFTKDRNSGDAVSGYITIMR